MKAATVKKALAQRPAWAAKLRQYQWEGAQWLSQPPPPLRGRLLNDDRGFGKTATGLAAARLRQDLGLDGGSKCVLVLTTASSRFDWRRDAAKFWPEAKTLLVNEKPIAQRVAETDDAYRVRRQPWRELFYSGKPSILACSYSTQAMEQVRDFILENDIVLDTIICDEAHYLKKSGNETAKMARFLIGRSTNVSLLTATAVHNTPIDLHNLLDIMAMGKWGGLWAFAKKYFAIRTTEHGFGQTIGELIDKEGLRRDIAIACLKRSVAEAYGELPAIVRELRRIDAGPTYRISRESARKLCDGGAMDAALRRCATVKLKHAAEFIADLDEPVVAYTYERKHAGELVRLLTKLKVTCTLATGEVPGVKRDALIEGWKAGSHRVLVCTMDAVKESATLVRAAAMVFCDLDWLPGKQLQCEGRIDPARQPEGERRPARYYYFVVNGGADEVVAERVIEKIQQSAGLIGDDAPLLALAGTLDPLKKVIVEVSMKDALADLVERMEMRAQRFEDLGLSPDDLEM